MDLVQQIIIWLFSEIIISEHFLYYGGIEQKIKNAKKIPQKSLHCISMKEGILVAPFNHSKLFKKFPNLEVDIMFFNQNSPFHYLVMIGL